MPATTPIITPANTAGSATRFPTETEIYLLPDGRVIVADLPAELAALVATIGGAAGVEFDVCGGMLCQAPARPASAVKEVDSDQDHRAV